MAEVTFTDVSSNVISLNEELAMNAEDIELILGKKDD